MCGDVVPYTSNSISICFHRSTCAAGPDDVRYKFRCHFMAHPLRPITIYSESHKVEARRIMDTSFNALSSALNPTLPMVCFPRTGMNSETFISGRDACCCMLGVLNLPCVHQRPYYIQVCSDNAPTSYIEDVPPNSVCAHTSLHNLCVPGQPFQIPMYSRSPPGSSHASTTLPHPCVLKQPYHLRHPLCADMC